MKGDEGAAGLVERAADELAKHCRAVAGHCGPDARWTYAGGTFSSHFLLDALERHIGSPPVQPKLPPIGGALLVAAQRLDWPLEEGWFGQITATAKGCDRASK